MKPGRRVGAMKAGPEGRQRGVREAERRHHGLTANDPRQAAGEEKPARRRRRKTMQIIPAPSA